jgi:hypothetical protein
MTSIDHISTYYTSSDYISNVHFPIIDSNENYSDNDTSWDGPKLLLWFFEVRV